MKIKLIRAAFTPIAIIVIVLWGGVELIRTPFEARTHARQGH